MNSFYFCPVPGGLGFSVKKGIRPIRVTNAMTADFSKIRRAALGRLLTDISVRLLCERANGVQLTLQISPVIVHPAFQ